jgi:hypothetical protein
MWDDQRIAKSDYISKYVKKCLRDKFIQNWNNNVTIYRSREIKIVLFSTSYSSCFNHVNCTVYARWFGLCRLTPLSTIFQLYRICLIRV